MDNRYIHYRYIIFFLFAVIVLVISLKYYDVPNLVDKLSFALTLSSLLLAIIAIFYTMISANKQDSQFSKLLETNAEIKATASEIKLVSERMNNLVSDVPSRFEEIGCKIDTLSEAYKPVNISQTLQPDNASASDIADIVISKDTFNKMFVRLSFAAMAVFYAFYKASFTGRNMELQTIKELGICEDVGFAIGVLSGLATTGLIEFKFHRDAIIPTKCDKLVYERVPACIQNVISVVEGQQAERLKNVVTAVDKLYV